MSTIQTFPQAASQSGKGRLLEQKSASVPQIGSDKPQSKDQAAMYPWSIGVTSVIKSLAPGRHQEECPPEVYIG
ncbi:MAG TPA: hypothetical protein VGN88_12270 [Phycisphaerae bacterium]|jgi:hypothetical protein